MFTVKISWNKLLADDTSPEINPCAILKDVVDTCATIVQVSFFVPK